MIDQPQKSPARPRWWLNTYFLFGILLAIVGLLGLVRGADFIRDPGQSENASLSWWYLLAAALFLANGYVSHRSTARAAEESDDHA
ncbi:MAG TPA: hypothetical protein VFG65_04980 [Fimbriimonadales bacterium]|nr:hypothetical protein [Fimbriimonadales bacterium]